MTENRVTSRDPKRDAKAQASADKAYRKASRPWYKKKRFILPLILLAIILISTIASQGGGDEQNTAGTADPGTSPSAAESAPAENAPPAFPGAQPSDVVGQGGEALVLGDANVTSTPLVEGDATFSPTLCTTISMTNNSGQTIDFSAFDWKLQAPSGTILNTTFTGTENILNTGQIAPGGTTTGDVCFEAQSTEPGQYIVFYEPIFSFFSDRAVWINNR